METTIGWSLIAGGLTGLSIVSIGYPVLVKTLARLRSGASGTTDSSTGNADPASVTVIVAMRNAEALLPAKMESIAQLVDTGGGLQVILSSDGSTDGTVRVAQAACEGRVGWRVLDETEHKGKHCALNAAVTHATGEVLVFTDVDALLEPGSVQYLVEALAQDGVGGVSGQRMIGEESAFESSSQARYIELDSGLKGLESRVGSITSNDGKLYAIRREAFEEIPGGVTDDLFANMSVVRQGWRFVFEGRARAWIKTPSRSKAHELGRRRRIVCRSFRGMWIQRAVLNPFRTGLYGFGLLINKVGRRLLPFFLLMVYLGTLLLALTSPMALAAFLAQTAGLAIAWLGPKVTGSSPKGPLKAIPLAHYALVGFVGTALGVLDFTTARQVVRWDPVKSD